MVTRPRVVIIGAGIAGCALADELTDRGWPDVTVLEQGDLFATGGSTSHAPGLVFQTTASKTMTEFAKYTVAKYSGLTLDGAWCFQQLGGLEIATTPERMADLRRRHGWATSWGVRSFLRTPRQCAQLHPMLDEDKVLGGFHIPSDGLAKPLRAAEAQARRAIERGAKFLARQKVTSVERAKGRVTAVVTETDRFRADIVVSCAGMWGPLVGRLVDLTIPMVPMAHQYAKTTPLPRLAGRNDENTEARLPILRHQDADLYFREHVDRIGIGAYGHRPMPIAAEDIADPLTSQGMPSELAFTPEDFEQSWTAALDLLPSLADTKPEYGINGLFSFTTDGMPLLGEHPDIEGFWVTEAVWITHSAGVAKAMAEWLIDGQPSVDLHGCDLNRFEQVQLAPSYVHARSCQSFVEVYDIIHPRQQVTEPRGLRTSPFHERQSELGAHFFESNGWERPQWYESNGELPELEQVPERGEWAARHWSPIAGAEAIAARARVALFDMTPLKRVEVSGPGALAFLQALTTNQLNRKPGAVTYTLLLGEDGGIRSDLTVARLASERFQVGINSPLDLDWLRRHLPGDGSVHLTETTSGTCCIGLWGPLARTLLQPLSTTDFSPGALGFFRGKSAYVGNVPVTALRLSYVGELGWELYTSADLGKALWDTLWEAGQPLGLIAAGRDAFNSMRLEKGYRAWGTDMTTEHDPFEAGVEFAVKMDKGYFVGRDALVGRSSATAKRRLSCLTIPDRQAVVLGSEPVFAEGKPAGYVTSAAYGYTTGLNIAYAWLPSEYAMPGTRLGIEYFGETVPAVVADEPLFDPDMTRLRA
ncbi:sarcosine dehydrogenase [Prauserella marina]|uniref:Glycine cleavage system T protein (Aminomethyltransferase) n=1 Tax=Prauserella marina TaxID=530584 RepID=A0A222VVF8_9PSEU|nr:FAD-dependent oxidoreductase [Prauserella marina]ASR37919.1 sarcosine dehydrogenase [Prauserella marina]PWV73126.1 dimethylglycine oxidase [Prauserella marina]SDD71205.1 Glycine cleavage system T protein (aminomethyltransferase) [Prauserella marina]